MMATPQYWGNVIGTGPGQYADFNQIPLSAWQSGSLYFKPSDFAGGSVANPTIGQSSNNWSNFNFQFGQGGTPTGFRTKNDTGNLSTQFNLVPDAQGNLVPQSGQSMDWNTNKSFLSTDLGKALAIAGVGAGAFFAPELLGALGTGGEAAGAAAIDAGAFGGATSAAEAITAGGTGLSTAAGTALTTGLGTGATGMDLGFGLPTNILGGDVGSLATGIGANATGNVPWYQSLFSNLGTGASAVGGTPFGQILQGLGGIFGGLVGHNTAPNPSALAAQADPFAAARPQFTAAALNMLQHPESISSTPGFKAGTEAVNRGMAAQGFLGSGNQSAALMNFGENFWLNDMMQLAQLGGANVNPVDPATLQLKAQQSATSQNISSMSSILAGLGMFGGGMFGLLGG
jgi:hypothetical protein